MEAHEKKTIVEHLARHPTVDLVRVGLDYGIDPDELNHELAHDHAFRKQVNSTLIKVKFELLGKVYDKASGKKKGANIDLSSAKFIIKAITDDDILPKAQDKIQAEKPLDVQALITQARG